MNLVKIVGLSGICLFVASTSQAQEILNNGTSNENIIHTLVVKNVGNQTVGGGVAIRTGTWIKERNECKDDGKLIDGYWEGIPAHSQITYNYTSKDIPTHYGDFYTCVSLMIDFPSGKGRHYDDFEIFNNGKTYTNSNPSYRETIVRP